MKSKRLSKKAILIQLGIGILILVPWTNASGQPTIITQPRSQMITLGHRVIFSVSAWGDGVTYQGQLNGVDVQNGEGLSLRWNGDLSNGTWGVIKGPTDSSELEVAIDKPQAFFRLLQLRQ